MSTLYTVSVRDLPDDRTALLDVQVVHPDSMYISPTPGFALMLLWEGTNGDGPLATEVDLETALDAGWMRKYAQGFVTDVEQVEVENEVPPEAHRDYDHDYWQEPYEWLRGTLRIEVTDPAWMQHLSKGQSWDSAAFEPNNAFDPCEPILFEESDQAPTDPGDQDPHAGLIPVPRVFFLDYLSQVEDEYVWFPKYSDKAYVADEVYQDEEITEELLDSLVGDVVWYERYGEGVGVMMPDHMVVRISSGSRGGSGMGPGSGKIGRARFNTNKKRLADPLTIPGMARSASPVVVDAEVDGPAVSLTVHCFEQGRELALQHSANALALIGAPECDTFDGFAEATSKLGTFLNRQAEERGIGFANQIFPQLAEGMIVEWTVGKTKEGEAVDWDALEGDELVAKLRENPWDTWTIRIVTTDPAWVEHLPETTPFAYGFHWVEEPKSWDEEPLTYTEPPAEPFPLSNQTSTRSMDLEMVENLAEASDPLSDEEWKDLVDAHTMFLETGGAGGHWQLLSASGLPLCIYQGAEGAEGEQFVARLKNLAGIEAPNSVLEFADFSGTNAPEIDLSSARLAGSVATDSIFDGANFEGAMLQNVDFSGSRMKGANFRNADLTGADFECCDLTGADFTGANLEGSRFPGAILDDAKPPK